MLDSATTKKLYFYILIFVAILGAFFLIFAVFLNRGQIEITAKAPYILEVDKLKSTSCPQDKCSLKVAPGKYNINIKKIGYKDAAREIKVPFNGIYKEDVRLEFIPSIIDLGERNLNSEISLNISNLPELKNLPENISNIIFAPNAKTALFYQGNQASLYNIQNQNLVKLNIPANSKTVYSDDSNYLFYLKRNNENFRQTLYIQKIYENIEDEIIITSFIRDLTKYKIIPSPDLKKVAIIDQSFETAMLYLVDIVGKNRLNLLEYPVINDLKWMPNSKDFLFEAKKENSLSKNIFLYKDHGREVTELELKNSLKNVAIIDDTRLIAATTEEIKHEGNIEELEGRIVILGSDIATEKPVLAFIDYSLIANQGRLIKILKDSAEPQKVELNTEKTGLYFLHENKLNLLKFEF